MRHKSRLTFKTWRAVISPLLLMFALLLFVGPVAAQTPTPRAGGTTTAPATQNFTDTPEDVVKNLGNQGYYVSQSVKANLNEAGLEQNIANTVKKLKGDKHDTRIAIIGNDILNAANKGNARDYASFLQGYLSNPKPQTVIVVNAQNKSVGLVSDKLGTSDEQAIVNDSLSTFNTKGYAAGATQLAEKTADKIDGNDRAGTITTGVIILVVVLLIGAALAFMYFNSKNWIKSRVQELQGIAGQVSNQVLNLSDTIEYLPDAVRNNTRNLFGQASSTFTNANSSLRQLEGANPWAVIFKRGQYEQQARMTYSQLETSRNALAQVQQTVDSATHM